MPKAFAVSNEEVAVVDQRYCLQYPNRTPCCYLVLFITSGSLSKGGNCSARSTLRGGNVMEYSRPLVASLCQPAEWKLT